MTLNKHNLKRCPILIINFTIISHFCNFSLYAQTEEYKAISTFSIVARDPVPENWALQSLPDSVVPWAKANVGAVATQSFAGVD